MFSDYSENAVEVNDVNNVEWIQQPDGSYSPWEWMQTESGVYECFLVYYPEANESEVIEQMADIYIAANREHLTDVTEAHMEELKKVYVADVQAKRNFGNEKGKGKSKGKGKWKVSKKAKAANVGDPGRKDRKGHKHELGDMPQTHRAESEYRYDSVP